MNVITFVAVFSDFVICRTESLVVFEGRKDVRKDGNEFLFFNCTVSNYPIDLYAEFLIDNISIASALYSRKSSKCKDLCKCQSDGRTYTWTYPVPTSKTSILFSCHIFVQHYSPEKANVWYNGIGFVDKIGDRKIVPVSSITTTKRNVSGNGEKEQEENTSSIKTAGESTLEENFVTPLQTANIMYEDKDSFSVETTTKDFISTLQQTSTVMMNIEREDGKIEITNNKPTVAISENDLSISSTIEGRNIYITNDEPSSQHWFYYGPLVGVGLFCIVLFACNILVNYKFRYGGRESFHDKSGIHQQAHITTSHFMESVSIHYESKDQDYESIGEIAEEVSNDDGNRSHSSTYLDVIDSTSDTTPYQVFSSFSDEDKHGYCVIENKMYYNRYNVNESNKKSTKGLSTSSGSSNSVLSCPSENQNEYVDILSWKSRNHGSDFCAHDIELFTVSSSSNDSLRS